MILSPFSSKMFNSERHLPSAGLNNFEAPLIYTAKFVRRSDRSREIRSVLCLTSCCCGARQDPMTRQNEGNTIDRRWMLKTTAASVGCVLSSTGGAFARDSWRRGRQAFVVPV
jgi:hypothetical protein